MGPSEGDDRPERAYRDDEMAKADKPMSPIALAQMELAETLSSVNSAVNRLTRQLMPIASDNLRKIKDGSDKLNSIADSRVRERRGTSPTLEMIEQQQAQAQNILNNLNLLSENLEV